MQAIDNRRLLHPQVHTPSATYQNPNHTRRVRLPHFIPVRELTDSAVQTEPAQGQVGGYADGSPPVKLDSGHGTASNSPSSSSTASKNQDSAGVDNYEKSCVTATLEIQKCPKDSAGNENVPPYRNAHCDMWSVGSPDSIVPVCSSSQQEDEVVKARRVSFPNLLSWERGQPKIQKISDEVFRLKENHQLSGENEVGYEKSVYRNPTGPQGSLVAKIDEPNDDARNLSSSRLMFSDHEQEKGERSSPEDLSKVSRCQMVLHNYQVKRKLNESIWSVESLVPFIPNKEVLVQKNNFESEKITEIREEAGNSQLLTLNDNASEAKSHIMACVGKKNPFVSLTFPLCQTTLSTAAGEEVDKNEFPELEVDQNPYQEPAIENTWQRKSTSSKGKESVFLSFAAGEKISSLGQMNQNGGSMEVEGGATKNKEASQLRNGQLCVATSKASQSNVCLVNRSIQCSTILPCSHNCWGGSSRRPLNCSGDMPLLLILYKMYSTITSAK